MLKPSELISDIKAGGSLGCNVHALVKFTVLRDVGWAKNKLRTLNIKKVNFQLFKMLVNRTLWEIALKDKQLEKRWQILRMWFIKHKNSQSCKKV